MRDDAVGGVLGVDDEIGRLRDDHAIAEHGNAERRAELRALVEHLAAVGLAVAVGVLEDDDAVALGTEVGLAAKRPSVVHRFEHPDAAALVDGDVGRVARSGSDAHSVTSRPGRRTQPLQGLLGGLLTGEDAGGNGW